MPIKELTGADDARARLIRLFGNTLAHTDDYVALLNVLCGFDNPGKFEKHLERVSAAIWTEYNTGIMPMAQNRFTRSIINLGAYQYGFSCQDNVVFTGPLSAAAFGQRVKGKVLWKDSFALDHGEFSHSYQWMACGSAAKWGPATAGIYASTAGQSSIEPVFHVSNGVLALETIPLWEWLVDCTLYQAKWDGQVEAAVDRYLDTQITRWCGNDLVNRYFNLNLIKPLGEKVVDMRGKVGARDVLVRDNAKAVALFRQSLIERFPTSCALTETTYRSANNVTSLVRRHNDWFINLYERHRTGFRDIKDKNVRPPGKMMQAQEQGQTALLNSAAAQLPTRTAREKAMRGTPFAPQVQRTSVGNHAHVTQFKSAHPLEGIKRNRMEHYEVTRQPQGWQTPDQFVYEKPYGITDMSLEPQPKPQQQVTYHRIPGTVGTQLPVNTISLLK